MLKNLIRVYFFCEKAFFGRVFGKLRRLRPSEDNKVYCHQYWKLVLVLVDFHNKAIIV